MIEVEAHGQELTAEFLDHLFVSILNDIPDNKWVEITKNHDQVIAGLKHIIDMDVYGYKMDIVFNNDFTHFRKVEDVDLTPHPFTNKYVDPIAWTRLNEIQELEEAQYWRDRERERRKQELRDKPKVKKRGRKR